MTNVLLISEDYIKSNSGLDDNVYGKYLLPAIREAQDMGLQTIIGGNLYDYILNAVEDNSIQNSANSNYKNLIDAYIQPYLLYKTIANAIGIASTKIANLGAMKSDDEKSYNVSKEERDYLINQYTYKADFYCELLQKYLCKNRSYFPQLSDCDCDRMKSNLYSSTSCSIWLGGERAYGYNKSDYIGK